jgi:hypothetical protein
VRLSHLAALSLVGSITFSPANHHDESELQPFVTDSFTRLPWWMPNVRADGRCAKCGRRLVRHDGQGFVCDDVCRICATADD